MSRLKRTFYWTVGGLFTAGLGVMVQAVIRYRCKIQDSHYVEKQIETLEGEGGICPD